MDVQTRFRILPDAIRRMERLCGARLTDFAEDERPFDRLTEALMRSCDGDGYRVCDRGSADARMPGGMGVSFDAADADITRAGDAMTALDLLLWASCVRTSAARGLVLFHYDLLACYANKALSDMDDIWDAWGGLLAECRSTVVDARTLGIASLPFYKFRNVGECEAYSPENVAAACAERGVVATEKLDGSFIQLRALPDGGRVLSTSNTLEGSPASEANSHLVGVRRRHVDVVGAPYMPAAEANPGLTLMFEMVDPEIDPHVVSYEQDRVGLWLIGARDAATGRLLTHDEVEATGAAFGIRTAPVLARDFDSVMRLKAEGDGNVGEGVVCDAGGWLVKVKYDSFLELSRAYHSVEGAGGFKSICKMVSDGALDDFLPRMPESARRRAEAIAARLASYEADVDAAVAEFVANHPASDRKALAMALRASGMPASLMGRVFATADGKPIGRAWERKGGQPTEAEFRRMEEEMAAFMGGAV